MFVADAFSNRSRMEFLAAPLMVVHGEGDRLIPQAHGRELFDLCPHERKMFVSPAGIGHNDDLLRDRKHLIGPMLQFFPLPDYCFDDFVVPVEAPRLAPHTKRAWEGPPRAHRCQRSIPRTGHAQLSSIIKRALSSEHRRVCVSISTG